MHRLQADLIAPRVGSNYPHPHAQQAAARLKRALGQAGGLSDFGVNLCQLPPGAWSSQRHWHSREDEFVYVLSGEVTLVTDEGEEVLRAGDCAGFPKNVPNGHHLVNRSDSMATYLDMGTRHDEDVCHYPDIDLLADKNGYHHRDGSPYAE